jgi:hypothetical protein
MKVVIYPPLHKLLFQLLAIILWDLYFFSKGCVLAMLLIKHANILIMILRFLLILGRLIWRSLNLCYKKITWTKKSGKGCIKWHRACLEVGFSHQKLKTLMKIRFVTKVIMFQETLEYHNAINISHRR